MESGAVEAGILPLVAALNSSGRCRTIASCHGHWDILALSSEWDRPPYVLFQCDIAFAKALHGELDPKYTGATQGNHYNWSLTARFHPDDDGLAWTLEAGPILLPEIFARRRINADVQTLVAKVRRLPALVPTNTDGREPKERYLGLNGNHPGKN